LATGLGDEKLWISATNDNTGTSTAFDDQSGQGNDGTANGGTLVVADTNAGGTYAFDFDGTNDYIDCGTSVITNTSFSMSGWFNADVTSGNRSMAGSYHWQSGERSFYVRTNNGVPEFLIASSGSSSGGNVSVVSSSSVSSGTWYHIAATWDSASGAMELFIDGSSVGTANQSAMASPAEPITLGAYSSVESFFNGKQDDIRFFQRALTQAEVTHLASARGVEGPAPVGLGDEKLWWVPTLSESTTADISDDANTVAGVGTPPSLISDTDNGGQYAGQFTTSGALDVNSNFEFMSTGDHTVCGWIKSNSNRITICGQQVGGFTQDKFGTLLEDLGASSTADTRAILYNGADTVINTGVSSADNTWHHLCFTRVGSLCTIYIDGVQSTQETHSNYTTYTPDKTLVLGGFWNGGLRAYTSTGYMDDIRVYERGISQAEVTHLATSRGIEGGPGTPPTTGFYNPFINKRFNNDYTRRIR